jgi:hypothetical protein
LASSPVVVVIVVVDVTRRPVRPSSFPYSAGVAFFGGFFVVRAMVGFYLSSGENNQLIGAKKRLDAKPWL